jgi:hypothetical protein
MHNRAQEAAPTVKLENFQGDLDINPDVSPEQRKAMIAEATTRRLKVGSVR